jgi:hypothetical protein
LWEEKKIGTVFTGGVGDMVYIGQNINPWALMYCRRGKTIVLGQGGLGQNIDEVILRKPNPDFWQKIFGTQDYRWVPFFLKR